MNRYQVEYVNRANEFDAAVEALRGGGHAVTILPEYCLLTDAPLAAARKAVMGINWILYVRPIEDAPDTQGEEQVEL